MGAVALILIFGTLLGGVLLIAWALERAKPRPLAVICDEAVSDWLKNDGKALVQSIFDEEVAKPEYAAFRFVKQIQAELQRVDKSLHDITAFKLAGGVYRQCLQDEKIAFGDPAYSWDAAAARDLAHAYEIDHWEAV